MPDSRRDGGTSGSMGMYGIPEWASARFPSDDSDFP